MSSPLDIQDSDFFSFLYAKVHAEEMSQCTDPLERILKKEEVSLSERLDASGFQESFCWRNVHEARILATYLIDDKGSIRKDEVLRAMTLLKENLFLLGPERHHDHGRREHLLKILKVLHSDDSFFKMWKRVDKPHGHQLADRIIKETLLLAETAVVTESDAKRAVLSALFTSLRQNVGSCFATAPAIVIQQEQPHQFLTDMIDILSMGRLTRVFEGVEYSVPLSFSWGTGDLYKPFQPHTLGKDPCKVLALSPGLIAAFQAAGLIDEEDEKKQIEECEKWLRTSSFLKEEEDSFLVINPEQLIHSVLLHFFGVTKKDVEEYRNHPREGVVGDFILQVPQAREGKSLAVLRFLKSYSFACNAFKAITDNPLLKVWEFTLASFSESKADFAKWNLFASLGLHPDEPFGIGECFLKIINEKIHRLNEELSLYQSKYDIVFAQLKSLEGRSSRGMSEGEMGWLQAEYKSRKFELHRITVERDEIYDKGRSLLNLLSFLIPYYNQKFQEYFQEVYDAEMHDISAPSPYDDSPAGFRLLYKHGRTSSSLWTLIMTYPEYIQALTSFFMVTEMDLFHLPEMEGLQSELGELITSAIIHIKRPEFLESSLYRLAKTYQERLIENPLENIDRVQRKPWAYVSGGTMQTLVQYYYGSVKKIEEKTRWVENETELLVFFLDCMKEAPAKLQKEYMENKEKSMLAFSPTHAFLFKPGFEKFRKGWEEKEFTYTWVRDRFVFPAQRFLSSLVLDDRMMDKLVEIVAEAIPAAYAGFFKGLFRSFPYAMEPTEFREYLLKTLSYEKWLQKGQRLQVFSDIIDKCLYAHLPFFPEALLPEKIKLLFDHVKELDSQIKEGIFSMVVELEGSLSRHKTLSAEDLLRIAEEFLLFFLQKTRGPLDYHQILLQAMQEAELALPPPLLFADSNWVKTLFGFVVSPGTGQVELWRFDRSGREGVPMSIWKRYLNGSDKREWGLYVNPYQYTPASPSMRSKLVR